MPSRSTGDATGLSCWSHLSSYVVCLLIVHAVICDLHGMLLVTGTGLDVGPAWQWAVVLHPAWVLPEWHLPSHSAQPGSCQDSPGSFNIGVDAKGRSCTRQRRGHPCQHNGPLPLPGYPSRSTNEPVWKVRHKQRVTVRYRLCLGLCMSAPRPAW